LWAVICNIFFCSCVVFVIGRVDIMPVQ